MSKSVTMVMAGLTIAALSGSVYARGGDCDGWGGWGGGPMMGGMSSERMEKIHDTRMGALHDKLKLTAKQEDAWKKFAAFDPVWAANRPDPAEMSKLNAPQRMEKALERMRAMEAKMAEHLATLKEFYAVLTAEQQKIFDEQMPTFGQRGPWRGR